jgi:hypothetical protein
MVIAKDYQDKFGHKVYCEKQFGALVLPNSIQQINGILTKIGTIFCEIDL